MVDPETLSRFIRESGLKPEENSKSYIFSCPKCGGSRRLWMYKSGKYFVCWSCKETENYQGRVEYALADLCNISLKEVRSRLGLTGNTKTEVYLEGRLTDFYGDDEEPDDFVVAASVPEVSWPEDYYEIGTRHASRGASYLESRGVSVELARQYGIRYAPTEKRVAFPVSDHGRLYGWQGRYVDSLKYVDEQGLEREILKIKSSTGIPRERTLMFSDRLIGSDHAVLAEGPVDAIKCHLCGGNVAAMGKAVSARQIQLLVHAGVRSVYLGLDPDAAVDVQRLVRDNFDDFAMYEMRAPSTGTSDKSDLGAMDYKEVLELFRGAPRIQAGRLFFFLNPKVAR